MMNWLSNFCLVILLSFLPSLVDAQSILVADDAVWNIGSIPEREGKVYHVFTCTNTGDKPVVICEVRSSCGCAVAQYPKYPIKPHAKAEIKVSFNPIGLVNKVNKNLRIIYNSGKNVCNLFIRGTIVTAINPSEDFQYLLADGLRIDRLYLHGDSLEQGTCKVLHFTLYNETSKTKKLSYRLVKGNRWMTISIPTIINPQSTAEIAVTIDTSKATEKKLSEVLYLSADGKELTSALRIAANIIMKY